MTANIKIIYGSVIRGKTLQSSDERLNPTSIMEYQMALLICNLLTILSGQIHLERHDYLPMGSHFHLPRPWPKQVQFSMCPSS